MDFVGEQQMCFVNSQLSLLATAKVAILAEQYSSCTKDTVLTVYGLPKSNAFFFFFDIK